MMNQDLLGKSLHKTPSEINQLESARDTLSHWEGVYNRNPYVAFAINGLDRAKQNLMFVEAVASFDPASGSIEVWEGREDEYDNFEPTDEYLDYINANEQHAVASDKLDDAEFWNGLFEVAEVA